MLRWLGCLASAIPSFLLAAQLLRVWVDPSVTGAGVWVRFAGGLMMLEFAVLFSAGLLGDFVKGARSVGARALAVSSLAGLYALLAWGAALWTESWVVVQLFAFLMAGRLLTLLGSRGEAHVGMAARAAVGAVCFVPLAVLALVIPWPALGLTPETLQAMSALGGDGAGGAARRALALGVGYFTVMGLAEVFVFAPARNAGVVPLPSGEPGGPDSSDQRSSDPALAISSSLGASPAPAVGISEK